MPEDANRKGDRATERIVKLFQGLGWTLKSKTDVDAQVDDEDRKHGYGLDAYLTYKHPYTPHIHGNIIESKSWKWDSVSRSKVEGFFETLLEKVDKAPKSEYFEETHNISNEADITNTGIVALWATDGFEPDEFHQYVQSLDVKKNWDLSKIVIWGNDQLQRIAGIEDQYHRLSKDYDNIQFYYPDLTDTDGGMYDLATMDYLLSDFIFLTSGERSDVGFVFYFGEMDFDSLLFMYKSLRHYQLLSNHERIEIFVPDRGHHTEPVEEEFVRTFSDEDANTDIEFKTLQTMADLNHLDNR
ncbi:hypothetical protein [Halobaculum roseum]|uniref:GAPS4 PD-(D/E)XK nuclease domain-containing protein n=1 Tax=Halobaculum roseum TaxID=2175149 RepID=A0ABD5MQG1_9EURY|nr:hypothetical protein [Halobaculum roseum]QZY03938.1 hypothetical protein K6T36_07185 [Halobaculum roseum]